jgi:hypothetical protein
VFLQWLETSQAGENVTYFIGRNLGDATPEAREIAEAAKQAYARGKVELVQARDIDGQLNYLAIRRKRVEVSLVNGSQWLPYISQDAVMARR